MRTEFVMHNQGAPLSLAASASKTLVLVAPAAAVPIYLAKFFVSFDGSAAQTAWRIDIYRVVTIGTPTGTSFTAVKGTRIGANVTGQATGLINLTAEPTAVEVLESFYWPPNAGPYTEQIPLGSEDEGESTSLRIGLRVVVPAGATTQNGIGGLRYAE